MVFTLRKRGFEGRRQLPSPFGFDALADGSIEPLPERLALSMGGSDRRVSGLGRHPRTDHGAGRGPFWQFSASIKSLQRKQCIIKKWSTQAYQKAYQIRPSPLRRKWSVQVAGASVATLPRGAECQGGEAGEQQPGAHAQPAGRAWRGLQPADTARRPQLNRHRAVRPRPLRGSGALPVRFYVHKNISQLPAS